MDLRKKNQLTISDKTIDCKKLTIKIQTIQVFKIVKFFTSTINYLLFKLF